MHELAITQGLVDMVVRDAEGARVKSVLVEVGSLAGVVPNAMRFCFDLVTEGTTLEGAELMIDQPQGEGRCRVCGARFDLPDLVLLCACGSIDVEIVAGRRMTVRSYEVV